MAITYAQANNTPLWLNSVERNTLFPSDEFYVGFAQNTYNGNKDDVTKIKENAKGDLIDGIRIKIESTSSLITEEIDESLHSAYRNNIYSFSSADVVDIKTEYYIEESTQTIYAFAYVDKNKLKNYYSQQLLFNLDKIIEALNTITLEKESGLKNNAIKTCENTNAFVTKVEYFQNLLLACNTQWSDTIMRAEESRKLKTKIEQTKTELYKNTLICIKSIETNFGSPSTILANKVSYLLSQQNCSFVDNNKEADFIIILKAITRPHDNKQGQFTFAYADIKMEVINAITQKSLLKNEISFKAGDLTLERAGAKALEGAASKVMEIIKPEILP